MKPQRPLRTPLCSQKEFPLKDVTELNKKIGLLINFNELKLKDGIKRMII